MEKMTSEERIERNTRAFSLDYNGALDMISENAEKAVSELIDMYNWELSAKVACIMMRTKRDVKTAYGCQEGESIENALKRMVSEELLGEDGGVNKLRGRLTEWKWECIKAKHCPVMKKDLLFSRMWTNKWFEFQVNIYENLDVAVSVKLVPTCWESSNNWERSIEIETMAFD